MNTGGLLIHPSAIEQLEQFLASPSQATLIRGPHGIGKAKIARLIAAELLGLTSESKLNNAAYFTDLEPKDGTITIEQVRSLLHFFRLKVPGNQKIGRVAVITDADRMSLEAQNALLKLLEEPPVGSVMILTSSHPSGLLSTIRSRVSVLHLTAPTVSSVRTFFEAAGHEGESVRSAVLRSGSDVASVYEILNSGSSTIVDSLQFVRKVLTSTTYERLILVESLSKQKDTSRAFVDDLAGVALASLESVAGKGGSTMRWQQIVLSANIAQEAMQQNGNTKLVLTELMLSL